MGQENASHEQALISHLQSGTIVRIGSVSSRVRVRVSVRVRVRVRVRIRIRVRVVVWLGRANKS